MIYEKQSQSRDENLIKDISETFGVSARFAKILTERNINSVEQAKKFLYSSLSDLGDPFLMSGMKEAVDRINAVSPEEVIVVYGDYDVDGISATTILTKCLRLMGKTAYAVIPERSDGYGLSEAVIERALEEFCPDLLITVDCGISAVNEVEYLQDLGVDVIVTDHHEIPDTLPDCTIISCKLDDDYKFNGLCGAGVAYNLSRALIGDKADEFLDMVALATMADSMPLIGENRILVTEGLKRIRQGKCIAAIKSLLKNANVKEITATSLSYSVAPRVNAAGRMGNANVALSAFLSEDEYEVGVFTEQLNQFNAKRQNDCEELYKSAKNKLSNKSPLMKVNVLYDKKWNTGLVGIVAARIAEETGKPTILFTESDGVWHGSARSNNSINIFEALKYATKYSENFGGHAQAAGVTVRYENLTDFENALDEYVSKTCDISDFTSVVYVDEIVKEPITIGYVEELEKLEPCGVENPRPLFAEYVGNAYATPLKYGSPHLSLKTNNFDFIYFNGVDDMKILNSDVVKALIYEPSASVFNGKKYAKGYVKSYKTEARFDDYTDFLLFSSQLDSISAKTETYTEIDEKTTEEYIERAKREIFGTLFIACSSKTVKHYEEQLRGLDVTTYSTCKKSNLSTVCLGIKGEITALYSHIVFLDKPLNVSLNLPYDVEISVNVSQNGFDCQGVTADRKTLGEIYLALKKSEKKFTSIEDAAAVAGNGYGLKEIAFAVKVFRELGLIEAKGGKFYAVHGAGKSLNDSEIYRVVSTFING
ncbi:MAG: single-stranded-DNA-specific exonuclease RecJ [Candidatus Borkfalkiaceae bacterium]|nr:single-stranded-DNA-specific exonuclease RecJ [Christensenellaceae bacterium]